MIARRIVAAAFLAFSLAACGGDSGRVTQPPPPPPPPVNLDPPANTAPTIDGIAAQGRRAKEPPNFADIRETIDVSASVRDPETSIDELVYQWSATAGTFTGTGRTVTWTAPDTVQGIATVTITLKVVENFGYPGQPKNFSHNTTSTVTLALHDSNKEVGDMAFRFLDQFSQPQTNKDWRDIMRDFKAQACPDPGEVDSERVDVEKHYNNYFMNSYRVDPPIVTPNFASSCAVPGRPSLRGDACVRVGVLWDSTQVTATPPLKKVTVGVDYLAAAYSPIDRRWWLCSSTFNETGTSGHSFYSR